MNRLKVLYYVSILFVVAIVVGAIILMTSMANRIKSETVKGYYREAMQAADEYYLREDYEHAAEYYRMASTKCPNEDECYIGYAMSMLMTGDADGALIMLESGLSQAEDTSKIEELIERINNGEFDAPATEETEADAQADGGGVESVDAA